MHNEIFTTTKNINDIKIALLSDIHYYSEYNEKTFEKLIKQINNNKPDYICIAGDILDNTSYINLKPIIHFLKELSKITTTIITLGNHDIKKGSLKHWEHSENNIFIKEIKRIDNLYLLEDEIYIDKDNNIAFYGFNLSYNYYEVQNEDYNVFTDEVKKLKGQFNTNTYNITIFHSPINIYDFINNNKNHNLSKSDLILSGHMHNGCLPFTFTYIINKVFKSNRSIISPTRKIFPKISQGKVSNIRDGYIHEGITKFSKSTRMFHLLDCIYPKKVEFITIKKVS